MILVEEKRRRNECDEKGAKGERRERESSSISKEEGKEEKKTRDSGEFVAYVERAAGRGSSHAPQSCLDTGQHRVALR